MEEIKPEAAHLRETTEGKRVQANKRRQEMLTFFTTAKPFRGHSGIIQRNALKSWTLLHPDVEVILFGDEEGAAEVSREFGLRHEPHVERNEFGTKRLDYMFCRAQAIARHDLLCYINCDILLMQDFCGAITRVRERHWHFLMVGRRWDSEITAPLNLGNKDWEALLRRRVLQDARRRGPEWIDYFVFRRGLFGTDIARFVVGQFRPASSPLKTPCLPCGW